MMERGHRGKGTNRWLLPPARFECAPPTPDGSNCEFDRVQVFYCLCPSSHSCKSESLYRTHRPSFTNRGPRCSLRHRLNAATETSNIRPVFFSFIARSPWSSIGYVPPLAETTIRLNARAAISCKRGLFRDYRAQ